MNRINSAFFFRCCFCFQTNWFEPPAFERVFVFVCFVCQCAWAIGQEHQILFLCKFLLLPFDTNTTPCWFNLHNFIGFYAKLKKMRQICFQYTYNDNDIGWSHLNDNALDFRWFLKIIQPFLRLCFVRKCSIDSRPGF